MYYKHFSKDERNEISILLKKGYSIRDIALVLKKNHSSVSREIKRGRVNGAYDPKKAHHKAYVKRKYSKYCGMKVVDKLWLEAYVEKRMKVGWSPEQISGRMKVDGLVPLSHETIYRFIYKRIKLGDKLQQYLRHKNRKYKSRKGIYELRGKIPKAKSIHLRSLVVENKERIGDFEVDTIIGKNHKEAIVTLVDRNSKFTLMQKVASKEAFDVSRAILQLLRPLKNIVKTITSDNGKEFAYHQEIERKLDIDFYFAEPYKSWQRGLNEHTNGLIREYIPKKSKFIDYSHKQITAIQDKLNHRPRKVLSYKTPHEVFFGKIAQWIDDSKLHYENQIVALDC